MKRIIVILLAFAMIMSLAGCGNETAQETTAPTEVEATVTAEPVPDWEYDEASKTLYVNVDMGAFQPDAPDFDGTSSNAPWAEYLGEIENIVVGDDVTFIGDYAFAFCTNLKNVEVGSNVGALDFRSFFKCGDFENGSNINMYFNSTPSFGDDVFGYTWDNPNVVIYVPDEMKEHWAQFIMQKGSLNLDGYEMSLPQGKDDIMYSLLMMPQELWSEGSDGFSENQGGEFGGGAAQKYFNENENRLEMLSDDNPACVPFNTRLADCGPDARIQQAIFVKFSSANLSDIRFSFEAMSEHTFSFRDDGIYYVDVANYFETPISNSIELKNDTVYYFMFAFDADANMRVFIWEENMYENQVYFETNLYQGRDDIFESNWQMYVGLGANNQININRYWVYTFDYLMDNSPYVNMDDQPNDMQSNDMDYGPMWAINIAGNFDIMSDMVWQSVQVQDIDANGDMYRGYNLAELMEFSGNGAEKAMVIFGDAGGSDIQVSPTGEAYIVFKKNDEFLGGPYLLFGNELMQHPVIAVNPN